MACPDYGIPRLGGLMNENEIGEVMTEAEKDAWIVQLRSDVVKYREAYRLMKYQLDAALKEIKELKEKEELKK